MLGDRPEKSMDKSEDTMKLTDFLICITLVAKINYDKKLKVLFQIMDDNQDGYLTSLEFLDLLITMEKIYL